jgi:hypothetical protein
MVQAVRAAAPATRPTMVSVEASIQPEPHPAVGRQQKSELGRSLAVGSFAVVAEMAAPRGLHLERQ